MTATRTSQSFGPPAGVAPAASLGASSAASLVEQIRDSMGEQWLPCIYIERIMPMRTRSHKLEAATRQDRVLVQHTLLGIELQVGRKRMLCPDLATARYLSVFARAGCTEVAVPYDITRISVLADELESSWHRMLLLVEHLGDARSAGFRSRVRSMLTARVREEIGAAGAGTAIPKFNQNTRQRRG
ncbi:MAG TPA: hypothetical protein VGB17_07115 [Pyrinomonadaceae bacterium]